MASDGPVSEPRKSAFTLLASEAGFRPEQLAFVTAYVDRNEPVFRRTVGNLAWGTFVWFASEPANLICLHEGKSQPVKTLAEWR